MNKRIIELKVVWVLILMTAVFLTACSDSGDLTAQLGGSAETSNETATSSPVPTTASDVEPTETAVPSPTNTPPTPIPTATPQTDPCIPPIAPYPAPQITAEIPFYTFAVVNTYPHDPDAFTQGLVWEDGMFYEGTGLYGRSSLRHVDATTGEVQKIVPIDESYFGEGIVVWDDRIIQITWQNQVAFVYDKERFEKIGEFGYIGEGWGLTHDGRCLIMSNGTNNISYRDPVTFEELGVIPVYDNNGPVVRLNELEYVNGEILANVWQTNLIARIDPQTGQVIGWIDLTNLLDTSSLTQPVDVLNGIAYDAENERLFVTGKLWPTLFEIELIEQ